MDTENLELNFPVSNDKFGTEGADRVELNLDKPT